MEEHDHTQDRFVILRDEPTINDIKTLRNGFVMGSRKVLFSRSGGTLTRQKKLSSVYFFLCVIEFDKSFDNFFGYKLTTPLFIK